MDGTIEPPQIRLSSSALLVFPCFCVLGKKKATKLKQHYRLCANLLMLRDS